MQHLFSTAVKACRPFRLLLCIIAGLILTSTGCLPIFYRTNTTTLIDTNKLAKLINQEKYFVLHVDSIEPQKGIQGPSLKGDTLIGKIEALHVDHTKNLLPDPKKENNRLGTKAKDRRIGLTEVHLYINAEPASDSVLVLPVSSIKRMDVYELNDEATRRNNTWNIVAITILGVGLPVLIYAMLLNMPY